ncbi:hypothetical protein EYF80_019977 [Liparis tanakae]|uniref:Uncharacterized protein n=1 Tax=Liparis tanakae TaxID=230148 RepID=A0A4Z2HWM6_9TELE|nr:hypothetical protein EYF80_019977 [Liparis tanakae]
MIAIGHASILEPPGNATPLQRIDRGPGNRSSRSLFSQQSHGPGCQSRQAMQAGREDERLARARRHQCGTVIGVDKPASLLYIYSPSASSSASSPAPHNQEIVEFDFFRWASALKSAKLACEERISTLAEQ